MGLQGEAYRLPGGIYAAVGSDDGADHRVFTVWMGAYHADVAAHDLHAIQLAAQGAILRRDEALRTDGGVHRLLLGACREMDGSLPGGCGNMVFPYIAMQRENAQRYDNREALLQGTLFPGLDLPFRKELRSRFPQVNEALLELMALDFAIDELGLYLTTHPNDQQALELYWSYIRLGRAGRAKYEETNGPLLQTDITEGGFRWLDDPWPWDKGGND